jgi:hypothetical protein
MCHITEFLHISFKVVIQTHCLQKQYMLRKFQRKKDIIDAFDNLFAHKITNIL